MSDREDLDGPVLVKILGDDGLVHAGVFNSTYAAQEWAARELFYRNRYGHDPSRWFVTWNDGRVERGNFTIAGITNARLTCLTCLGRQHLRRRR